MCVEPFIIKTYQKEKPLKLVKARFESEHNILDKVCVIQACVTSKKNLTAHAISCGKFYCVTMSSILRAKTLKQQASKETKAKR